MAAEAALERWFATGSKGRRSAAQAGPGRGGPNWAKGPDLHDVMRRRARLSHLVRRQQRGAVVGVPVHGLETWGLDEPPPTPTQQADNLITWIGDQQQSEYFRKITIDRTNVQAVAAWLGAPITRDDFSLVAWLAGSVAGGLIDLEAGDDALSVALTLAGWARHAELQEHPTANRRAFMAMKFDEPVLVEVFTRCFQPAAARAGFTLRTALHDQPAGQIDDQMRVSMRTARFVVADLTHGSFGPYWEAGFAEGLGRPVIYTCRKADWDQQRTHFDTNHLVTVVWDPADLADAQQRLVATIRATLPTEAVLEDAP
ncbi:MAG TPA: hypothetical protein VMT68_19855 [Caulobacteraceae bacterium]|nr:hypothetical protein [Caulobacteraceae bacterium]